MLGIIMTGPALMQWGTDAQKKRYLKPILAGDEIWCEGMSEPGAGSDLASIQMRAELQGDEFIVNGQKVWTTSRIARTSASSSCAPIPRPKHKGMSALLVDMNPRASTVSRSSKSAAMPSSTKSSSKTCACPRKICSAR